MELASISTFAVIDDGDEQALFDRIATALTDQGYIILAAALAPDLIDALAIHFLSIDQNDFKAAGIGKEHHQVNRFVRNDKIYWLDPDNTVVQAYLSWTEKLRLGLNRRLFLGLFDYECHYAYYPVGAFYKKHVDAFKGAPNRVVSSVLYLNPQWAPHDGGELLLYAAKGRQPIATIIPYYGMMVLFLSQKFPHEVRCAGKPRYSLAGWFRLNGSTSRTLDPPR